MAKSINSYSDCLEAFKTVRNPLLGKPINGKDIRLYRDRDLSFRLTKNERTFAVIRDDDTITFVLDSGTLRNTIASSLVYIMGRFLPMGLYRVGPGRYRIGNPSSWENVKHMPEYTQGIKFNLTTGQCLNPQPDRKHRIDKEARKVWTKTLATYRKGLYARIKLGVMGDRENTDRWFTVDDLFQWMKAGEYPDRLFNYLIYHAYRGAEYEEMTAQFEKAINNHRDTLRRMFGVFDE
jgi:hypothetical protein